MANSGQLIASNNSAERGVTYAAGGILWRPHRDDVNRGDVDRGDFAGDEVEVAVVHRKRYDDWSLPKGKVDPGEALATTAVREIVEETGYTARLGRSLGYVRYDAPRRGKSEKAPKEAHYWSAQVVAGSFVANDEVDQLRWVPVSKAASLLSYPLDRTIVDTFTQLPPNTSTTLIVRHAKAGSKKRYVGLDDERPLDATGFVQARALVPVCAAFHPDAVISAPPIRCQDTVAPLVKARGLEVQIAAEFSEAGFSADPQGSYDLLREVSARPATTLVCSQGGAIPSLVQRWADADGVILPTGARTSKASLWVLSTLNGTLLAADYLDSPLPVVS